ncbi:MAG: N-acyl homoserine lactonase family protein [Proteobacteria bacterium]|jgi:glyoxylase-like metal-dependent hydrolase (beta-lactamase superfamily II)|nr:N-acyl homoserine lactonase family protein [Pseudomonadota bacterium]
MAPYEVYAIRYAHNERPARDNFMFGADIHDGPQSLDYFIWLIRGNGREIVVDLGFDHMGAARRGRTITRLPSEGLQTLGVDPGQVKDVIVTHLHYDHAGDLGAFPNARLHLQEREMMFATGRHMGSRTMRAAFDVDYVCDFVRAVYDDRVLFVDGASEVAPGISVHHIGGHTDGHQAVRVWTAAGWLVLASDAVHLYANREQENPFPIVYNVGDMIAGYQALAQLADRDDLIIPGHDPLVLARFPAADPSLAGEVARLDLGPLG